MKSILKISVLTALTIAVSFASNSENATSVSSLKLINPNTCYTIPIPPPKPGSPNVPLG